MIAAAWKSTDTALLVTVIVLLTFSGFFALAETALVRMSRSKAAALRDERRRDSAALDRLASSPDSSSSANSSPQRSLAYWLSTSSARPVWW